ncbi:hypothetical protein B0A55_01282 [Friedmanniomyces simplex]|uniref:Uncharacterized protein n=1 Tax=Friedmanniomyces simplex TaxID=329884 RepID=A0A4U0XXL6_9PEZI|nr:hypothetical protein B0A55_01282 [Friedmanniomyces simplex]
MSSPPGLKRKQGAGSLRIANTGMDQGQEATINLRTGKPPVTVNQLLPIPGLLAPSIDINALNGELQSFNNLLAFAPSRDAAEAASAEVSGPLIWEEHSRIHKDLVALRRQLADAKNTVDRLTHEIRCSAAEQAIRLPRLHIDQDWYEQDDLLTLKFDKMRSALQARPPSDPARFAAYIRSTWYSHAANTRKRGERTKTEVIEDIMCKLMHLSRKLASLPESAFQAFHTLMWLKAKVIRRYSSFTEIHIGQWSREADVLFEQLLRRPRPRHTPSPSGGMDPKELGSYQQYPAYYDCSSARRELWRAYAGEDCSAIAQFSVRLPGRPTDSLVCFHAYAERMLGLLNKHAYQEIEQNVWLAVGAHLPEELAEQVFQYALAAEEVPPLRGMRHEDTSLRDEYRCATRP